MGYDPQTVNAYFNPTMNEIVFPAILQPSFFDMKAEDAINYREFFHFPICSLLSMRFRPTQRNP